jgi:hypothetical protein
LRTKATEFLSEVARFCGGSKVERLKRIGKVERF